MARPRIAWIGPVLPLRGGVAQHGSMLVRALAEHCTLLPLSYRRLYPPWAYPGRSAWEPGARAAREAAVRYELDAVGPSSWRRAADAVLRHRPDAVVLTWWTVFTAPCTGYLVRAFGRAGLPVVFVCHNVLDHEPAAWKTTLTRRILGQGDGFVLQSQADVGRLERLLGPRATSLHAHPAFVQFPEPRAVLPRHAALELLFFGFVRRYKGLDVLIEALAALRGADLRLSVVGEFWRDVRVLREQVRRLGLEREVELVPRYLPAELVAGYFDRADAVVLPYRSASGSGVLALAQRYARPVVVTPVAGLAEHVEHGRTGVVASANTAQSLAETLAALDGPQLLAMRPLINGRLRGGSWSDLARCILARCAHPLPPAMDEVAP